MRGFPSPATPSRRSLEPAFAAGTATSVPAYIALRLATVTRTEAATAVVDALRTCVVVRASMRVHDAWAARTAERSAMRDNSRELGRGLLRLADRLWDLVADADRTTAPDGAGRSRHTRPVSARCALAEVVAYDDVQTVAVGRPQAPAPRPGRGHRLGGVVRSRVIATLVADVAGLDSPLAIPATSSPWIEAARRGPRHHRQEVVPCLSQLSAELRLGICGPVGHRQVVADHAALRRARRRARDRGRHQRHLHRRGRPDDPCRRGARRSDGSWQWRPEPARTRRSATTSPPT